MNEIFLVHHSSQNLFERLGWIIHENESNKYLKSYIRIKVGKSWILFLLRTGDSRPLFSAILWLLQVTNLHYDYRNI